MNPTWHSEVPPADTTIGLVGWLLALSRGTAAIVVLAEGLFLLLLLRLIEWPLFGMKRPWTPHITVTVCRLTLQIFGLKFRILGDPMQGLGSMVANHSTWLDILALNSRSPLYFVAKSEVSAWPAIGWLARATGTVFVRRRRSDAQVQRGIFEQRITAGHRLLFFPEGTSTDGTLVLPFKSTLFAAFFSPQMPHDLKVQPVTVRYVAPIGKDSRFYGWWGDMALGPHLLQVLAQRKQGIIVITYHNALNVAAFDNRKGLATACELAVRSGLSVTKGN